MSATWKYLLGRLGLLIGTFAVLWPTGLDPLVIAMAAVLISFVLSFVLLRKWRIQMMENADDTFTRRREEKAQLRMALAGEDGDEPTDEQPDSDSEDSTEREDRPKAAQDSTLEREKRA
ncbi:MAG TPA: DUF4229 domain-containing protein [Candidatus Stackebrandtia faecavium]|nr:DUF4229 domain-containing protein [Candidatus Stackebrandtia faecavium]